MNLFLNENVANFTCCSEKQFNSIKESCEINPEVLLTISVTVEKIENAIKANKGDTVFLSEILFDIQQKELESITNFLKDCIDKNSGDVAAFCEINYDIEQSGLNKVIDILEKSDAPFLCEVLYEIKNRKIKDVIFTL